MYNYYVIEMQTNADGTGSLLPYGHADKGAAEDQFHSMCISARQGGVMIDTVMFVDNKGNHVKQPESYVHPVEPAENTQGE